MTREEIIADKRYHTCGRCKWEDIPYICHQCKWGEDTRKDLWELKEDSHEDKVNVLKKIRAEIEQITDTMGVSYNQYVSKIDVLQIIDKYKAEGSDSK